MTTGAAPSSPGDLFVAFSVLALKGFGGVLPVAQHELVERHGWLTRDEFAEMLAIGQALPGPNVVNIALMFGDRHFGWRGAAAALAGIIAAPLAIVLAMALLYARVASLPLVADAMRGMSAAAAGLIFAIALKLAPALRRNPMPLALRAAGVLAAWVLAGVLRVPIVWIVLGLGGVLVVAAGQRLRKDDHPPAGHGSAQGSTRDAPPPGAAPP